MLPADKEVVFYRFVARFGQKYGSFSSKKFGIINFCQNPFSAILGQKKKKVPMATKLEGMGVRP